MTTHLITYALLTKGVDTGGGFWIGIGDEEMDCDEEETGDVIRTRCISVYSALRVVSGKVKGSRSDETCASVEFFT